MRCQIWCLATYSSYDVLLFQLIQDTSQTLVLVREEVFTKIYIPQTSPSAKRTVRPCLTVTDLFIYLIVVAVT